jgi:hypothetical protein
MPTVDANSHAPNFPITKKRLAEHVLEFSSSCSFLTLFEIAIIFETSYFCATTTLDTSGFAPHQSRQETNRGEIPTMP